MGLSHSPKIVTDGLVLALDAGNTKSYLGSGTTWTDLTGKGNNGTLTNGPTFDSGNGGSIVFDAVDDFVQCGGSLSSTTSATFIAWIKRNGNIGDYTGIIFSRSAQASGLNFRTNQMVGYHWASIPATDQFVTNLIIPDLTWCMCALSVQSTSATCYLGTSSGVSGATNTITHTSTTLDDIELGRDNLGGARIYKGNIAIAQVYNRALTDTEILQNFNALRGRFGL
jgi:hypothetical protein